MSMTNFQANRMKVSAAPDEEMSTGRFFVVDKTNKKTRELDTDTNKEDHYRSDVIMIEKDTPAAAVKIHVVAK
eukprot:405068-Amphidinium_carterae.1